MLPPCTGGIRSEDRARTVMVKHAQCAFAGPRMLPSSSGDSDISKLQYDREGCLSFEDTVHANVLKPTGGKCSAVCHESRLAEMPSIAEEPFTMLSGRSQEKPFNTPACWSLKPSMAQAPNREARNLSRGGPARDPAGASF